MLQKTTKNQTQAEDSPIPLFIAVPGLGTAFLAFVINVLFVMVGIKSLRKTFHNLLVLLLCANDGLIGFSFVLFTVMKIVQFEKNSFMSCFILIMVFSYGFCTSYIIIFLICFARFMTIRSLNYSVMYKLERYKYQILIGAHVTTLVASVVINVSFMAPPFVKIQTCTPSNLFKENYRMFIIIMWVPISLMVILLIFMYILSSYWIWKVFLRADRKNRPMMMHSRKRVTQEMRYPKPDQNGTSVSQYRNTKRDIRRLQSPGSYVNENSCGSPITKVTFLNDTRQKTDMAQGKVRVESPTVRWQSPACFQATECIENNDEDFNSCHHGRSNADRVYNRSLKGESWEVRAFKTNLLIASTTIFLTGPFVYTLLYDLFANEVMLTKNRHAVFVLSGLNYILDPFIYAYRVPEIREKITQKFCGTVVIE